MQKKFQLYAFVVFSLFLYFSNAHAFADQPCLHICTVASNRTQGLQQLLNSCDYQNVQIDVLGMDKPFRGLSDKLIYVLEYIQNLPDSDIVMFVDAYDVLFMTDADTILSNFLEMGHPFIISGERYCWPLEHRRSEFPPIPTSFKYVNSGVYMGYVDVMKFIFNSFVPIDPLVNDQDTMTAYYLDNPGQILIDANCVLFLSMAGVYKSELIIDYLNKQVTLKETGTRPCTIHGNGCSRAIYQSIYDELFKALYQGKGLP